MITAEEAKAMRTSVEAEAQIQFDDIIVKLDQAIRDAAPLANTVMIPVDEKLKCWLWTREKLEKFLFANGYKISFTFDPDGLQLIVRW